MPYIQYLTHPHPRPLPRRGDIALASPFVYVWEFGCASETWCWVLPLCAFMFVGCEQGAFF